MIEQIVLTADQAADEIVRLINSSPWTPSKTQIADVLLKCGWHDASDENGELATEIRAAIARKDAAIAACGNLHAGPALDKAEVLASKCCDELRALVGRLPSPPRGFADIAVMAEIAFHYANHDVNGRLEELDDDDWFHASAARLIEAVLQLAEARHA